MPMDDVFTASELAAALARTANCEVRDIEYLSGDFKDSGELCSAIEAADKLQKLNGSTLVYASPIRKFNSLESVDDPPVLRVGLYDHPTTPNQRGRSFHTRDW